MNLVVWAVIGGGHSQTPFCPPSPCHNQSHDLFISDCLFPYVVNPHGLPLSFLMRTIDVCCVTTSSSSCSQPSGTLYWNRTSQLHFLSFLLLSAWPAQLRPSFAQHPNFAFPHSHPQRFCSSPSLSGNLLLIFCLLYIWDFTYITTSAQVPSPLVSTNLAETHVWNFSFPEAFFSRHLIVISLPPTPCLFCTCSSSAA